MAVQQLRPDLAGEKGPFNVDRVTRWSQKNFIINKIYYWLL